MFLQKLVSTYESTWHCNSEEQNHHLCCENFKSHTIQVNYFSVQKIFKWFQNFQVNTWLTVDHFEFCCRHNHIFIVQWWWMGGALIILERKSAPFKLSELLKFCSAAESFFSKFRFQHFVGFCDCSPGFTQNLIHTHCSIVSAILQCASHYEHITHPEEEWHNSIFMGYYWTYIQTNYW
jgi:hypothetical protein